MWPQIQACWMDSGVCLEGNSQGWERSLWSEHCSHTRGYSRGQAGCTPGLSFGHQPGQCGQQRPKSMGEVWRGAVELFTAHILQGILVCFVLWGMLTKEICHEERTGATSGSNRAPEREQWDRHQSHRALAKGRTSSSVVWHMNCRALLRPGDAASTRDNHLGSGASAGQGNGSPPSSTPAWHHSTACELSKGLQRPFPTAEQPLADRH